MKNQDLSLEQSPSHKIHIPLTERLKSIPEIFGIRLNEEPSFEVLKEEGPFQIRRYSKQLRARITLQGMPFEQFREAAFLRLADYLFEGNKHKISMAMTAPVLQQKEALHAWTMEFTLPSRFSLKTAPPPKDPRISIEETPGYTVAVVAYSGNNSLEQMKKHEKELVQWLSKQPFLQTVGRFFTAQYDAPFVIPFMKKNEIQVKVANLH